MVVHLKGGIHELAQAAQDWDLAVIGVDYTKKPFKLGYENWVQLFYQVILDDYG